MCYLDCLLECALRGKDVSNAAQLRDASTPKLGASEPQSLRASKGPCNLTHTPLSPCTSPIPHTSSSAQGQDLYQLSGSDAENLTCAENALVCTTPMQR